MSAAWLLRKDWAARRIEEENRGGGWFLLLFALFWNGIAWTATIGIWSGVQRRGPEHYFVLLFPLIGILVFSGAIYALLRRQRYGAAVFELATLPAPLGRALAGHVRVGRGLAPNREITLSLRAIHRIITRSGKSTSTKEEILWESQRNLPGAVPEAEGVVVPIAIPIPRDAPETSSANPSDRILWRLELKSVVPGVDFLAQFEVPVFYTAESDTPLTPEELARFG